MSGDSSQEKTEQPTEKKKRDARKKGQVPRSRHAPTAATMAAVFGYFIVFWDDILGTFDELFAVSLAHDPAGFAHQLTSSLAMASDLGLRFVGIFLAMMVFVAVAANVAMAGLVFSGESIKISFDKIHPKSGFKKIFAKKNAFEFLISVTIISTILLILRMILRTNIEDMLESPWCGLACIDALFRQCVYLMSSILVALFVVLAAIDYRFQIMFQTKELMMTKEEIKKEYKEMEGDPFINQQRKQIARETVEGPSLANATVMIGGSGIAVILYYKEDETPLPQLVVKARDDGAARLAGYAQSRNVPIVDDAPLAKMLAAVPAGEYIREEMIADVARVLGPILQAAKA